MSMQKPKSKEEVNGESDHQVTRAYGQEGVDLRMRLLIILIICAKEVSPRDCFIFAELKRWCLKQI